MFFLVFHGEERMDDHTKHHLKESPLVVTIPLLALAIPSVFAGYFIDPIVVGNFFKGVVFVDESHKAIEEIAHHYHEHGLGGFILHGLMAPPFWLSMAGLVSAWYIYMRNQSIADWAYQKFRWLHTLLDNKYYADDFNQAVFAGGALGLGKALWKLGDRFVIDGLVVNGSAKVIGFFSSIIRHVQTGYMYHYAFSMILGVLAILSWFIFGNKG